MSHVLPQHPDELPASFGRYRLMKLLGKGGMGSVFLAHDPQLDRSVALKVPQLGSRETKSVLARFTTEARAAGALHHPNICPIHEVGEIDGIPYLTMAFVEGKPLGEYAALRPPSQRQSAVLVRKLALALDEAHKRGVVHRDLKPANVMINRRGEPVIMDFGLARRARPGDPRLTQDGACMGTPAYMPPEQVKGEVDAIGPASDIYSLGVILYELLARRLPFRGDVMAVLARVVTEEPPPPSQYCPDLDPELEAICLKAMAKQIKDRYPSMAQLAAALLEYSRGSTAAMQCPQPADGSQEAPANNAAARRSPGKDSATQPEGIRVSQMGGLRSMAMLNAQVPANQTPSTDKPRKRKPKREPSGRMPPWVWIVAGGGAALLVALVVWAAYRATNYGTIRIDLGPVASAVNIQVDGAPGHAAGQELRLPVGEHHLTILDAGYEIEQRQFTVRRGRNPNLQVTLRPKKSVQDNPQLPGPDKTLPRKDSRLEPPENPSKRPETPPTPPVEKLPTKPPEKPRNAKDDEPNPAAKKLNRDIPRHKLFLERIEQSKGKGQVIFLGDSITNGWESQKKAWKEYFGAFDPVNLGIGGDQTGHVLWRITEGKELEHLNPKAAVVMIGTNNIGVYSAEQIAGGIKAIVEELKKQKPGMKILVLGVFPRGNRADASMQTRTIPADKLNKKIPQINAIISELADGKTIFYKDIGKEFLNKEGGLSDDVMPDYLHLSARGYDIWGKAIKGDLEKLLK